MKSMASFLLLCSTLVAATAPKITDKQQLAMEHLTARNLEIQLEIQKQFGQEINSLQKDIQSALEDLKKTCGAEFHPKQDAGGWFCQANQPAKK